MKRLVLLCFGCIALLGVDRAARSSDIAALVLEAKIPLGSVRGRIDHLAVDVRRSRLYVAELGNDSIGVVDLKDRKLVRTLTGFREPQGIAFDSITDAVFIANGGDGTVRKLSASDWSQMAEIDLGDDADNVRIDGPMHRAFVGYGDGALAMIDTASFKLMSSVKLHGHPESFQLEPAGPRIYINIPDAHTIAVVDRGAGEEIARWSTPGMSANFPMAIDQSKQTVISVFRSPPVMASFNMKDASTDMALPTCADADDVFLDSKRHRIYVVCGEGVIDVFAERGHTYSLVSKTKTVPGARTGLYSAELDQLFIAVRATANEPAAIWSFRPSGAME